MQFNNFFNSHTIYVTLDDDNFYKLNKDDFSKMEKIKDVPVPSRDNPIMIIHKKQFDLAKSFLLNINNPFRIELNIAEIYHKIGFLSNEELDLYIKNISIDEQYNHYKKEYQILKDMYVCSTRYLSSEKRQNLGETQQEIDEKIKDEIKELYRKYSDKINKECVETTGKSIY